METFEEVRTSLNQQTKLRMTEKPVTIFWSNEGELHFSSTRRTSSSTLRAEGRNIPIPLRYIDVTRTIHTTLDVLQESSVDDYWNIDANQNLSESTKLNFQRDHYNTH